MSVPSQSSGLKSADTAICARPCILMGVQLLADATNAATVVLYDHATAASGTVIDKVKVIATGVYEESKHSDGVVCQNGIYADVTGTGAEYIVHFKVI